MDKVEFLKKVEEQFQETEPGVIQLGTAFKDVPEWGSLVALCIIAMVDESYGKTLTGDELSACATVNDIFETVQKK